MKKNRFDFRRVTAIAVCLAVATMCIACNKDDDSTDDSDGNGGAETHLFAGKFASQRGGGEALFYADYLSADNSVMKATGGVKAETEKELVGKIKDGDIIFNLNGFYNQESKQFTLSAGSNSLIYSIAGTLSGNTITETEATVKVKTNDEWATNTVTVTSVDTETVAIDGAASDTQTEGLPSEWLGEWIAVNEEKDTMSCVLSAFELMFIEYPDMPDDFFEITHISEGKYEIIMQSSIFYGDDPTTREFGKMWIEQQGENLLITIFTQAYNENYAEAKAYVIPEKFEYDEMKIEMLLIRP